MNFSDPPSFAALRLSRPAGLHRAVQYGFLAFFLWVGLSFYFHAMWAMGHSSLYVAKPPAVEAFLPVSALLGLKRLLFTGQYDSVHPAGLTILLMAITTALFFRKGLCGYLCPVGALSMLLDRLGRRLGISRGPGKGLSLLLTLPKYPLLAFFLYIIFWSMSLDDVEAFIHTPYNMVADTKMLLFFLDPSFTLLVILGVLVLGSMLIPGFWCRGFCPYGALLGIFSLFSPVAVWRQVEQCTGCLRCSGVCPSRIPVHEKTRVSGAECVGCAQCVGVCPQEGCLSVRLGWSARARALPFWSVAAGSLAVLALFYVLAVSSGNWRSELPPPMTRMLHENIRNLAHP